MQKLPQRHLLTLEEALHWFGVRARQLECASLERAEVQEAITPRLVDERFDPSLASSIHSRPSFRRDGLLFGGGCGGHAGSMPRVEVEEQACRIPIVCGS